MSSIQEIKQFEEDLYEIVAEYLRGGYTDDYSIVIRMRCRRPVATVEETNTVRKGKTNEIYPLSTLTRPAAEPGSKNREPDIDRLSEIAGEWVFLD